MSYPHPSPQPIAALSAHLSQFNAVNPSRLDPDHITYLKLEFQPTRLYFGLTLTLILCTEDGVETARYTSAKAKLGGRPRLGPIVIGGSFNTLLYPPGRYHLRCEVANFDAVLATCVTAPFSLSAILPDRSEAQELSFEIETIFPQGLKSYPAFAEAPWTRRDDPIWAQARYSERVPPRDDSHPLFLHLDIPRSSPVPCIDTILPQWFPEQDRWANLKRPFASDYIQRDELHAAPPDFAKRLDLITGPEVYGALPPKIRATLPICFFKDPIDRAALDWHERARTVAKNPERTAQRDPKSKWLIDTFPTVEDYIAQADFMADYWRAFLTFEDLQDYYMRRRAPRPGDYTERFDPDYADWVKATALARIEALPFVLLADRFDDSLVYMHLAHGLPLVPYQQAPTPHAAREALRQFTTQRLRLRELRPDIAAFHDRLVQRFDQQIGGLPGFQNTLQAYLDLQTSHIEATREATRHRPNKPPSIDFFDVETQPADGALVQGGRLHWSITILPSRPCLGLKLKLTFADETDAILARVDTAPRTLGGAVRWGRLTIEVDVPSLTLPAGTYSVSAEIKNFAATLAHRPLGQIHLTAPGDAPLPIDPGAMKSERSAFIYLNHDLRIQPEPDRSIPAPITTPWSRKSKPVWAVRNYRTKLHGGYKKRPLALHIHIPKCGGTTLRREILPRWFPDPDTRAMVRDVFTTNYVERDELFCAPTDLLDRLLLISGHDSYGCIPQTDKQILPLCFFRDPFDRAASLWSHHIKGKTSFGNALQTYFTDEDDFLRRSDIMQDFWRSFLTFEEMLDFIGKPRSREAGRELRDVDADYYTWFETTARQRIDQLPFVLSTERFDESLIYLHMAHDFPIVPYERQRVNRDDAALEAAAARKASLREALPEVAAFHDAIDARFLAQIATIPGFEERLNHYQWLNARQLEVGSWRARVNRKFGI